MFRRRSTQDSSQPTSSKGASTGDLGVQGDGSVRDPQAPKGRPTPRRSDHAKQRLYDHAPTTRKEAAVLQRQRESDARAKAKAGMATGDERYMLGRDRGPVRRLARDAVDARISLGTLLMPMAVLVLLTALFRQTAIYQALNLAWLGLMVVAAVDWTILGVRLNRTVKARFPNEKRGAGLVWYVIQRSLIPRRWRQPKPAVKLGEKIV